METNGLIINIHVRHSNRLPNMCRKYGLSGRKKELTSKHICYICKEKIIYGQFIRSLSNLSTAHAHCFENVLFGTNWEHRINPH